MSPALAEALADLPPLLRAHVLLSGAALGLAILAFVVLMAWFILARQ